MMHRFYINPKNISKTKATLDGDDARHLHQVLRLKKGEPVLLFDGFGTTYKAIVEQISKSTVQTVILESQKEVNNPPFLNIAQCVLKKKKMELIVQKSTELGVNTFLPVLSQNCSLTYRPSTQESRWQKIATEACKQCGRSFIPEIRPMSSISDFFADCKEYDHKIILWENESKDHMHPFHINNPPKSIILLIGPEGGFTEEEVSIAQASGFTSASLGSRILRAETAAIAALSVTQYLLNPFHHKTREK